MALLQNGSNGDEVTNLQNQLITLGFELKSDGIFGKATEGAVTQLQKMFNYNVDGKVGPATTALIEAQIGYGWNVTAPDALEKAQASNPVNK